jgi:prevent-host-death family protein
MPTRLIGIQKLRQNLAALLKEAQKKNLYFIVMRHSTPVAKIVPLTKKGRDLEELAREVAEARADWKKGNYYTSEEIEKELGL